MSFHAMLLFSTAAQWTEYISYMRRDLDMLVGRFSFLITCQITNIFLKDEKARFSRVGQFCAHDYAVTFSDSQRVQNIRERLLRAIVVLDANLEVVSGCKAHCRALSNTRIGLMPQVLTSELEAYSAQLRSCRGTVVAILEQSRGTLDLVQSSPQSIQA